MTRRALLGAALAAPFLKADSRLPIKKAVEFNMLPKSLAALDAFRLAKDCGFEEIECPTTPEQSKAEEMLDASKKTGLRIHSVMNQAHWSYPLSSPDPAVVEKRL
jgi:L-ribulose-5-phosphate 3-epimerase